MKNVGSGYDQINSKIFKGTYKVIIDKLVHFINMCITHGRFPARLKIAVIKPTYKAGNKALMTNYRPISMLPYISKILEKIIHKRTMDHLENHNILTPSQFGFRKRHSTYMPLIILQNRILDSFQQGKIGWAIYLDLWCQWYFSINNYLISIQ